MSLFYDFNVVTLISDPSTTNGFHFNAQVFITLSHNGWNLLLAIESFVVDVRINVTDMYFVPEDQQ